MDAGARVIHFDVMDGHFVPPITIGPLVLGAIADQVHDAGGAVDVHLMIEAPERQIEEFAKAGADSITFHEEATPHANRTLHAIRELGCLAGDRAQPGHAGRGAHRAARPRRHRPLHDRQPRLGRPVLHRVLAGQGRAPAPARRRRPRSRSTAASTPPPPARVAAAGASLFVAGSAVFGAADPARPTATSPRRARTSDRLAARDQGAGDLLPPGALEPRRRPGARRAARTSRPAPGGRRSATTSSPVTA